jgi:hypothetical protein
MTKKLKIDILQIIKKRIEFLSCCSSWNGLFQNVKVDTILTLIKLNYYKNVLKF